MFDINHNEAYYPLILSSLVSIKLRMEKLAAKSRSSQAKVIGSIISIAGAFVLTFYKGPSIINALTHLPLLLQQPINFLKSEDESWAIAGILLIADYFLASVWYIVQVGSSLSKMRGIV